MQALIGLAILIVTLFIILQLYKMVAAEADSTVAEEFCRQTNAWNVGLLGDKARAIGFNLEGCKKIDLKQPIPSKTAPRDIGDLTARCWWMWLEGLTTPEGKSENVLKTTLTTSDKDCFVCYTFFLEKGNSMSPGKLSEALSKEIYRVEDGSDKCAPKGGGYCQESCEKLENPHTLTSITGKTVNSDKCKQPQKCCVPEVANECVSKGGKCEPRPAGENFYGDEKNRFARNNRWLCNKREESCFVPQSQFLSYVDYIQEGGKGPGMLALSKDVTNNGLTSGKLYAVVFNEDTTAEGAGAVVGAGVAGTAGVLAGAALGAKAGGAVGTVALPGVGTFVGVVVGGVSGAIFGLAGSYVGYNLGSGLVQVFEAETLDQIVIANMEEVTHKDFSCAVQYGVKG